MFNFIWVQRESISFHRYISVLQYLVLAGLIFFSRITGITRVFQHMKHNPLHIWSPIYLLFLGRLPRTQKPFKSHLCNMPDMEGWLWQDERRGMSLRKSVPLFFNYRKMELSMSPSQITVLFFFFNMPSHFSDWFTLFDECFLDAAIFWDLCMQRNTSTSSLVQWLK